MDIVLRFKPQTLTHAHMQAVPRRTSAFETNAIEFFPLESYLPRWWGFTLSIYAKVAQ